MRNQRIVLTLVGIACLGLVSSAQGPQKKTSAPGSYTAPRNAFGQPDLEGVWANDSITPLQRPVEWANKTTLTEAEVRQLQAASRRLEESGDALFLDAILLLAEIPGRNVREPHAGKIRLTIRCARGRRLQVGSAVGEARNSRSGIVQPLSSGYGGNCGQYEQQQRPFQRVIAQHDADDGPDNGVRQELGGTGSPLGYIRRWFI